MKPYRILLPFSYLYGAVMAVRNAFFEKMILRTETVTVPVISVGNMTTGGTGKTPIVALIASAIQSHGLRPAIVSRGYRRETKGMVVVSDGERILADAARAGDEPHQLAHMLPGAVVVADEIRVRGARYAQQQLHADCIILDDGFQHRKLGRTLDLVLIDGTQDLFSMPMLPAGHRREPLSSLGRADAFIITKCADTRIIARITASVRAYNAEAPILTGSYEPEAVYDMASEIRLESSALAGRLAVVFSGIGQPEQFRTTCRRLGIDEAAFIAFDDHHPYSDADLAMLERERVKTHAAFLLTTEKDAHRLSGRLQSDLPVYYVKMHARVNEREEFEALIARTLSGLRR